MSRAVVAAYLACALIWGTTWYVIRVCIGDDGYPTRCALALRFALAAIVLLPVAARLRPWPTGRTWAWLGLAGALDAAGYLLVYLGEERVPGAVAAVVYGTQPLILAVALTAVRLEVLTRAHLIGALISIAGVVVLFLDRLDVSAKQAIGVAMIVGSVVIATTYSMILKRHAGSVHTVVATAIFIAVTAIIVGVVALIAGEPPPWPLPIAPTFALVYLALVGSVIAFLAYFWLLERTSLIVTSTLVFVYPLVALAVDAVFERELPLGPRAYAGAAITLGGLAVSLRRQVAGSPPRATE